MSQSSIKKISNDMLTIEKESESFIPADYYYMVKIKITRTSEIKNYIEQKSLSEISEILLQTSPKPIAAYYTGLYGSEMIILLFSNVVDNTFSQGDNYRLSDNNSESYSDNHGFHEFEGNHSFIISKYLLFCARQLPLATNIVVNIIHLATQTKIFTYLSWIIFQISQQVMINLSNGKITIKDVQFRTDTELKNVLLSQDVAWDTISPEDKYGTILKIKFNKKGKQTVSRLSELLDSRDTKKYTSFLFS
jgi:hypothetical protein